MIYICIYFILHIVESEANDVLPHVDQYHIILQLSEYEGPAIPPGKQSPEELHQTHAELLTHSSQVNLVSQSAKNPPWDP
jgi:hypothetical protein